MSDTSDTKDVNQRLAAAIGALWTRVPAGDRVVEIVDATPLSSDPTRLRVYTLRSSGGRTQRRTYDLTPDGRGGWELTDRTALQKRHPLSPDKSADVGEVG